MTVLVALVGVGTMAYLVFRAGLWISGARVADGTVPHPLPAGFRLEMVPAAPGERAAPHVAVVVPVHLTDEQVGVQGEAGRWFDRRYSHPRERRVYAAATDADVAARFAVRWFHAFHARLDEAEAVMSAWNGPEGPLPVGVFLAVEVHATPAHRERAAFIAHLMPDGAVPADERDATSGTGVEGPALGIGGAWPTASGATADEAARAVHRALLHWQARVRDAHLVAAGWS